MTGYCIDVGYNSAYDKNDVWEMLKNAVHKICSNPLIIIEEVKKIENIDIPKEYAHSYKEPWTDLTIQIKEEGEDIEDYYISQLASGGGIHRDYKEAMRRAFCRIILAEMHKKHMEINIRVT